MARTATDETGTGDAIGRRYGRAASDEWRRLLARFELGEGFSLIVLLVPDKDGATLCEHELDRVLAGHQRGLLRLPVLSPPDLIRAMTALPGQVPGPETGAVWIEAAEPQSAADFPAWERGWRMALEGLNQQRNPLRESLRCPVLVVGAPWIVPLFRDVAPDLWSIRSQVIRIEPERVSDRDRPPEARLAEHQHDEPPRLEAPDPEFALREAERLSGAPDRVSDRAVLLLRAGQGLLARDRPKDAEVVLREAADLTTGPQDTALLGFVLHELGRAIRDQGRAAEAEAMFRRALALREEGGGTATSRSMTADMLGRAILDQGRAAEAEAIFRRALALAEEGRDRATSRGITADMLGRAIRDQGRAAEAEAMFRQALALKEEGGGTASSRGITAYMLGRAIRDQRRAAEAEAMFRRALALLEEGGDTATSRGITVHELGRAILDQGRAADAEAMFRRALALLEEGGATATSRGITADMLGRAILDQGRAAEAEAMFRHALALAEQGNAGELLDLIRGDLERATKASAADG